MNNNFNDNNHSLDYLVKFAFIVVLVPLSTAIFYHLGNLGFSQSSLEIDPNMTNSQIKIPAKE
ncbi:MAG: hypothetical protein QNJ38_14695 [Prochloraceae cyanobacterium]|nr:hypothetical protein [Prochloraceae cyanobacterium]